MSEGKGERKKKRKNEKSLAEVFSYGESIYMPIKRGEKECTECAFYDICDDKLIRETIGSCVAVERSDETDIIIKAL